MANGKADAKGAIKGLVALVVIVVILLGFLNARYHWVNLGFFGGADNPAIARDLKVLAIDVETEKTVETVLKKDESYPLKNTAGKETLWAAYVCWDEKILFPATPKTMVTTCPNCGSNKVGAASVGGEEAGYPVKMPITLPRIPQ
jgi:hypothetical protein